MLVACTLDENGTFFHNPNLFIGKSIRQIPLEKQTAIHLTGTPQDPRQGKSEIVTAKTTEPRDMITAHSEVPWKRSRNRKRRSGKEENRRECINFS